MMTKTSCCSVRKKTMLFFALAILFIVPLFASCADGQFIPPSSFSTGVVYGVNVDITALIPDTPYTVKTASGGTFFDLATQLGINTLRITDVQWSSVGEEQSKTTWQYVFNEAERHHMKIILLLDDSTGSTALDQANTLLGQYGLATSPALWLVDLDNEPDVSDPQSIADLSEEAAYIHRVVPGGLVTIGGWKSEIPGEPGQFNWQDPADLSKIINLVNVVSPHLYQFDQGSQEGFTPQQWTRRYLGKMRQEALGKPILLEEFGAGNGLAPTTDPEPTGSLEWQASVYQGVLQEVTAEQNQDVLGAVAWIFAPRPAWPDCNCYEEDMTGWSLVIDHGQRILPAAKEFSAIEPSK